MNHPNTWFTRSFLARSAHQSNKIYNKIKNIWFPLPAYSVLQLPKQCLRQNVALLNFCLCVYNFYWSRLTPKFSRDKKLLHVFWNTLYELNLVTCIWVRTVYDIWLTVDQRVPGSILVYATILIPANWMLAYWHTSLQLTIHNQND